MARNIDELFILCSLITVTPACRSTADYTVQINIVGSGTTKLRQTVGFPHYRWLSENKFSPFIDAGNGMEANLDYWRDAGRLLNRIR